MDIYKILKDNSDSIIKEDLDFFEIELAVGSYDSDYVNQCLELISEIRKFKKIAPTKLKKYTDSDLNQVFSFVEEAPTVDLIKKGIQTETEEQKIEKIKREIENARSSDNYHEKFKNVISSKNIDEQFIDKNYLFFKTFEIDELIKVVPFSESFLEKYFKLLNHKLVAEFQFFSESFYIKHFNQLDYKIVLKKGKNEWIAKDKRSSKLSVFLKLKGITI